MSAPKSDEARELLDREWSKIPNGTHAFVRMEQAVLRAIIAALEIRYLDEDKPCTLRDCPEGLFKFGAHLGFKSEYRTKNGAGFHQTDAYVVESGEYFWGGASSAEEREKLIVIPVFPSVDREQMARRYATPQPEASLEAREALDALENACEALAAKRSRATYLSMIDQDGCESELRALDDARQRARAALSRADKPAEGDAGRYEALSVFGGLPTDCCDYGVVSLDRGKEVCRVWDEADARLIADLLNAHSTPEPASVGGVEQFAESAKIPAGMVPWHGGDSTPEDYGGACRYMLRDGSIHDWIPGNGAGPYWSQHGEAGDIIAYTPRATAQPQPAEVREKVARLESALADADALESIGVMVKSDDLRASLSMRKAGRHA